MICENLTINEKGHLCLAGQDTIDLANKYGTPLYLMDGDRIRERCCLYKKAMSEHFGNGSLPLYAGKAAAFRHIYRIMKEEEMGIDVVSPGEIYSAYSVNFPMSNAYFHGNNKTDADICYAIEHKVGHFVVDNKEELDALNRICEELGIKQNVIIRLTPGIDPHTYAAVSTGQVDSKFGTAIETGQALEFVLYALSLKNINLEGFHCHVGSQVFDSSVYLKASRIMLDFIADLQKNCGYVTSVLDLGGGYGVRYKESDPFVDIEKNIKEVADSMREQCKELGIELPSIRMEPGRSIVADAGMTLYTVGSVKMIPGYKNYISIDGGMTDNPRYALYKSPYTVLLANNVEGKATINYTIAGRCCESGDLIQENCPIPSTVKRGDTIAVLTTGAYNYSMSMTYNRIPRPAMILLEEGTSRVVIMRETYEDLCSNEL